MEVNELSPPSKIGKTKAATRENGSGLEKDKNKIRKVLSLCSMGDAFHLVIAKKHLENDAKPAPEKMKSEDSTLTVNGEYDTTNDSNGTIRAEQTNTSDEIVT